MAGQESMDQQEEVDEYILIIDVNAADYQFDDMSHWSSFIQLATSMTASMTLKGFTQ